MVIRYAGRGTWYDLLNTDTIREVKEKKSKEEGVDVDGVDLAHDGRRLDDDQQWWQTGVYSDIYMYRR